MCLNQTAVMMMRMPKITKNFTRKTYFEQMKMEKLLVQQFKTFLLSIIDEKNTPTLSPSMRRKKNKKKTNRFLDRFVQQKDLTFKVHNFFSVKSISRKFS